MKNMFKLLLVGVLCCSLSAASAQQSELVDSKREAIHQQKVEAAQQHGQAYDNWKHTQTSTAVHPNALLRTEVNGEQTTHVVRLGKKLADNNAAAAYKSKLEGQPGVLSVVVDHATNTVQLTVKTEDEYNALLTYFDID